MATPLFGLISIGSSEYPDYCSTGLSQIDSLTVLTMLMGFDLGRGAGKTKGVFSVGIKKSVQLANLRYCVALSYFSLAFRN